jgi:hypothetical protein
MSNINLEFRLSPWNQYCFLVFRLLYGVWGEFTDVLETAVGPIFTGHELEHIWAPHSLFPLKMGRTVVSKTLSVNSPCTPCKNPRTKKQMSNSCTCCRHAASGRAWVLNHVHSHVTSTPWFVTQFLKFDDKTFPFLGKIMPEVYNYLVLCQMLQGVIQICTGLVQCAKTALTLHSHSYVSSLSGKFKRYICCKNLSCVLVSPSNSVHLSLDHWLCSASFKMCPICSLTQWKSCLAPICDAVSS